MAAQDQPEREPARPPVLVVDVGGLEAMDIIDLGALVRLQLVARRFGASIELRNACPEVIALLQLAGFDEVLPCSLLRERGREPEEREEVGVDEEVNPVDPAV
jgi:hypothetical protein